MVTRRGPNWQRGHGVAERKNGAPGRPSSPEPQGVLGRRPPFKGKRKGGRTLKDSETSEALQTQNDQFFGGVQEISTSESTQHIPGSPFCRGESSLKSPQSGFWCLWEAQKHPKNTGCVTCVFRELSTPVILQSKSPVILQWRRLQGSQFFLTTSS